MDFAGVASDAGARVAEIVKYILPLNIHPDEKYLRIARVARAAGTHFHARLYGANCRVFGVGGMQSAGIDRWDGQAERLANKIVRSYALSRDTTDGLIQTYFNSLLAQAQEEAFVNAASMQKHPTLERVIVGDTCEWCTSRAGVHTNPTHDDFVRHGACDCRFITHGYNTRNGVLKNYTKGK